MRYIVAIAEILFASPNTQTEMMQQYHFTRYKLLIKKFIIYHQVFDLLMATFYKRKGPSDSLPWAKETL